MSYLWWKKYFPWSGWVPRFLSFASIANLPQVSYSNYVRASSFFPFFFFFSKLCLTFCINKCSKFCVNSALLDKHSGCPYFDKSGMITIYVTLSYAVTQDFAYPYRQLGVPQTYSFLLVSLHENFYQFFIVFWTIFQQ